MGCSCRLLDVDIDGFFDSCVGVAGSIGGVLPEIGRLIDQEAA